MALPDEIECSNDSDSGVVCLIECLSGLYLSGLQLHPGPCTCSIGLGAVISWASQDILSMTV